MSGLPLRIALVSKANGSAGGASFFAENLGAWLRDAGQEAVHFIMEARGPLRSYQRLIECQSLGHRVARHVNWRARRLGMLEPLAWEYGAALKEQLHNFDLFHFHDLYMAISPRNLMAVARHKAVCLTIHDCSAFTGGCLYPMNCRRFTTRCGECPSRREIGWYDFTASNLDLNRRLAGTSGIHYLFPSRWIREEAAGSLHYAGQDVHLANGFDGRAYKFAGRREAKQRLGIPDEKKVVLISSAALGDHRKGVSFALNALRENKDLDPFVLVVGKVIPELEQAFGGLSHRKAGFLADREQIGLCCSAADLLLFPSLADNLPITIEEAMAAGTPVLAFAVGGVPELVRSKETGWLVPAGDQAALNRQLREILLGEDAEAFGRRAQSVIADEFSVEKCVKRHLELYRRVIAERN